MANRRAFFSTLAPETDEHIKWAKNKISFDKISKSDSQSYKALFDLGV